MIRFYLVRHGQTEWNQNKRMQGWQDSPLTADGIRQAEAAARELQPVDFCAACVSPTGRARRTIGILLDGLNANRADSPGRGVLAPVIHDGLAELGLGAWEGSSYADDREGKNPDPLRHAFWNAPETFDGSAIGAENFQQVTNRVLNALDTIADSVKTGTVLVVSHTIAIRSVLNHFLGLPIADFWQEPSIRPCGVSILNWQSRRQAQVLTYGDKIITAES